MKLLRRVETVELFPELSAHLLELLRGLSDAEWGRPTVCAGWSVKDLATHLLGDELGNLSRRRDRYVDGSLIEPGEDLSNEGDLIRFINRYNEAWVQGARRLSPRAICDWLEAAAREMHLYFASLDLQAIGGPVSWAGPEPAPVWLDVAREYTERWHHQQQIRDATGRAPLLNRPLFSPVLDTFARALPHTYRNVDAGEGTSVTLTVTGDAGGSWWLRREESRWLLLEESPGEAAAEVVIDQDRAWRLFTKGITPGEASARLLGDKDLGAHALSTVSIIA